MIGKTVGRYRILSKLGQGGMGSVWRGEDPELGRPVALKFLAEGLTQDDEARRRFLREARAASVLDHPGIATVYDFGEHQGQVFIAFQLVEGRTLREHLRNGPLPLDEVLRLGREVADALQAAHARGVVHRDLSSRNIMVRPDGRAVVVDFGLARPAGQTRYTMTGTAMGTIGYMSPEVARGKDADARSDIYALGVLLYEMLTGSQPFQGERLESVLHATIHEAPQPPGRRRKNVPASLEAVILRALAKPPEHRQQTAGELAEQLQAIRDGEPLDLPPVTLSLSGMPTVVLDPGGVVSLRPKTSRSRRLLMLLAPLTAALVFLALHGAGWSPFGGAAAVAEPIRIAVLPLRNLSERPGSSRHLVSGLSQDLTRELPRPGLQVTPWATVRRYADDERAAGSIARELGVDRMLTGTVRMQDEQLHVQVGLVDAATGMQVWAAEFQAPRDEYFQLLASIAEAASVELAGTLEEEQIRRLTTLRTSPFDAYETYLKGVAILGPEERSEKIALSLFNKAVATDPQLAEAYVGIGAVLSQRYFYGRGGLGDLQVAEDNFQRALDVREDLPEARAGLIHLYWFQGENEECLKQGLRAMQGSGGNTPGMLFARAQARLMGGLPAQAVPLLEMILQKDPRHPGALWYLTVGLAWTGRFEESLDRGLRYLDMHENDPEIRTWLGVSYHNLNDHVAAAEQFERALELFGDSTNFYSPVMAGHFFAEQGDIARARAIWRTAEANARAKVERQPDNPRLKVYWAILLGLTGHMDEMNALRDEVKQVAPMTEGMAELAVLYIALGHESDGMEMLMEMAEGGGSVIAATLISARSYGVRDISHMPGYENLMDLVAENGRRLSALY